MVTIDGEDSKDLDDAVSLTKENDIYHLGVHIADAVSYTHLLEVCLLNFQAYL